MEGLYPLVVAMLLRQNWGSRKIADLIAKAIDTPEGIQVSCAGRVKEAAEITKTELNLAQRSIAEMDAMGALWMPYWGNDYPRRIRTLSDMPVALFCIGEKSVLKEGFGVTIVGTRRASVYGIRIVREIFSGLKTKGGKPLVYISGLAYGIDSEVHRVALESGIKTIAVVPGAIGSGFPVQNRKTHREICEKGAVVAEFPPGRKLFKGMFPMRNRLLAALADVVVVVEAGIDSGAMLTAKYAKKLGKRILTFPYEIYNKNGEGCNKLISEGAEVVLSRQDLMVKLGLIEKESKCLHGVDGLLGKYSTIVEYLNEKNTFTEFELIEYLRWKENCQVNPGEVRSVLTKLELKGILRRKGQYYEQFSIS